MGSAKQCDRCKKLYTEDEIIEIYNTDKRMRLGVVRDCCPYGSLAIDLCKGCRMSLANWLEES